MIILIVGITDEVGGFFSNWLIINRIFKGVNSNSSQISPNSMVKVMHYELNIFQSFFLLWNQDLINIAVIND